MSEAREHALVLTSFDSALDRFEDALRQPKTEWTRDAAIQRFEFTFELAWKTTARAAFLDGVDCASPRQTWKAALRLGWIDDDAVWLDMLDDRNRTSHTYNEEAAEQIYSRLAGYAPALRALLARLRSGRVADSDSDE